MDRETFKTLFNKAMDQYHEYLCEGEVGDPERIFKADADYWVVKVAYEAGQAAGVAK